MKGSNFRNVFSPLFIIYSLIFAVCLVVSSPALAADSDTHQGHEVSHAAMGMIDNSNEPWAQQLKGQTIVADEISGRANRSALVELQHNQLMAQLARPVRQATNPGLVNG